MLRRPRLRVSGAAIVLAAAAGVLATLSIVTVVTFNQRVAADTASVSAATRDVRALFADDRPLTISVLGDSTGNMSNEWVGLWAARLAEKRAVTVHYWDAENRVWLPPQVLSRSGPTLAIWNMGAPGTPFQYVADRTAELQPVEPDLVVYNFGHNNTADDASDGLRTAMAAVRDLWGHSLPSVVILQNPETDPVREGRQVRTVEELRAALPPTDMAVDVYAAFEQAGVDHLLLEDGIHPNDAGSELWATTVAAALDP